MKIRSINKSLLISASIVALFASLIFLFVFLVQRPDFDIASVVEIEAKQGENKETVGLWSDGERLYAFLPSGTESVTLNSDGRYSVSIDRLSLGKSYSVDELSLGTEYSLSVKNKSDEQRGSIVFMRSETIPSLFISTASGAMDYIHAVKGNAEVAEYTLWDSGESATGRITLKGRGNTSWTGCEKKGYTMMLEQEASILGLDASVTYLLIANARCNYLSNTVAFWLSSEIGVDYVPGCRHIDLYLNGEYAGNYILCEQIAVGENSVNITDLDSLNMQLNPSQKIEELVKYESADGTSKGVHWLNQPTDMSGGFLLERDVPEYYADEVSGFVIDSGDHFVIKGPKYASESEVNYIKDYVQQAYDAISSADGYNPTTGLYYGEYIDIDSFVLKYVLEEFLNFNDAGRSSAYYYKELGGKLCAGPGWDFEGAFKKSAEEITMLSSTGYSTDWYQQLMGHEDFRDKVKAAYRDLLLPALERLSGDVMPMLHAQNAQSAKMDEVRWGREDFDQSCEDVLSWIATRIDFLNEMWLSGNEYVTVTVKCEWQNDVYLYLVPGDKITEDKMPNYIRDGYSFGGWLVKETGEAFDFESQLTDDITLVASWVKADTSLISSLLSKMKQVVPELIFIPAFSIAFILFVVKFVIKEKKK